LIKGVLRRWYIAMLVFLVVCAVGLPAIWYLIKPVYSVTGAIQVAPIIPPLLPDSARTGQLASYQNYENFLNTQAEIIVSGPVRQGVADDLKDKNLAFFEDEAVSLLNRVQNNLDKVTGKPRLEILLQQAILDGVITVAPARNSELIKVTVRSKRPNEAEQIVNSFIRNYMFVEGSNTSRDKDRELVALEDESKVLAGDMDSQRASINQLAQTFGDANLTTRHNMKLDRVGKLLATLTEVEAKRIYLESQAKLMENREQESVAPEDLLKMREEYINKDPALGVLTSNIVQMEQEVAEARQILAPTNEELKRKVALLDELKKSLDEKKTLAGENFDKLIAREVAKTGDKKLANAQAELEQTKAYEDQLRQILAKEDDETIGLGRTQLTIQDLQDKLALTKELKDRIDRRIQELKMERRRPGRVDVAYNAEMSQTQDKRIKLSIALIFAAAGGGVLLAFLREKADHSVRTPDDVAKRIGIRIIGTTTSSHTVKPSRLPEQVAGDYQTIRANLGLLNGSGMPKKLVVTSPGMREGKTTFAINLALSMSRSGKKVLLVDGDLRKPDIASLLGVPKDSKGLQDVAFGTPLEQAVYSISSDGLDVLSANFHNMVDAFELLASPSMARCIDAASRNYDHVIIDTPPMLAFPDALIWAKIGDAVILTCFSGQTKAPDLKEAKRRLAQINVKVLGTILSNVEAAHSYHRYGYDYYARYSHSGRSTRRSRRKMLLPVQSAEKNPGTS
jgi:succinoglycan biosynthesis transport protein ExoP